MEGKKWYLGLVERIANNLKNYNQRNLSVGTTSTVAYLRPTCETSSEFIEWQKIDNTIKNFPDSGYVIWVQPPENLIEETLWQIQIEPSAIYLLDDNYYQYKVADYPEPTLVQEVIDLRSSENSFRTESEIRRWVTEEGVALNFKPSKSYLWETDNSFFGPFHLAQLGKDNKWYVNPTQCEQEFINKYEFSEKYVSKICIDGVDRYFLVPGAKTGPPVDEFDWSNDRNIIKKALETIININPHLDNNSVDLLRTMVEETQLFNKQEVKKGQIHLLHRASEILNILDECQILVKSILDDFPFIKNEVTQSQKSELSLKTFSDKEDLKLENNSLTSIQEISSAIPVNNTINVDEQIPWNDENISICKISDYQELNQQFESVCLAKNLDSYAMKFLHLLFLSGAMPVLSGTEAYTLLKNYANSVVGNRWLWLPISSLISDPSDILGKCEQNNHTFIPSSSRLLDLLIQAKETEELYLVILDGINQANVDSYLTPITACYSDAWQEGMKRNLKLFHPSVVAKESRYFKAHQLDWPANVLLSGIISEGVSTIPMPSKFWINSVLFCLEIYAKDFNLLVEPKVLHDNNTFFSMISFEQWCLWRQQFNFKEPIELQNICKQLGEKLIHFPLEIRKLCCVLYSYQENILHINNPKQILTSIVRHIFVPYSISIGKIEDLLEVLEQIGFSDSKIETSINLATKVLI